MDIYRYRLAPKYSLGDKELVELIQYINTYVGRATRCCRPSIEYKIPDQSSLRFVSKGKAMSYGGQVYIRIPFRKNFEVYFRYSDQYDTFRFIISNSGPYLLYALEFGSKPLFASEFKFVARI